MFLFFFFLVIRLKWFECSWFISLFTQFKNSRSFASYQQLPNCLKRSVYCFIWIIPYPSKMIKRWVVDQSFTFSDVNNRISGTGKCIQKVELSGPQNRFPIFISFDFRGWFDKLVSHMGLLCKIWQNFSFWWVKLWQNSSNHTMDYGCKLRLQMVIQLLEHWSLPFWLKRVWNLFLSSREFSI